MLLILPSRISKSRSSYLYAYLKSNLGCRSYTIGPMRSEKTLYASSSLAMTPIGSSYSMPDLTQIWMLPPLLVVLRLRTDQTSRDKCFFNKELKLGSKEGYATIGTFCGSGPETLMP